MITACLLATVFCPAQPVHVHPPARVQTADPIPEPWRSLAECESRGEWDYGPHSDWGSGLYDGGLQFDPDTWNAFAPPDFPAAAYDATPHQQIHVAELVQAAQGWRAWPACSREIGLR